MIMLATKYILLFTIVLQNSETYKKVAESYLNILLKNEINTEPNIHYICERNKKFFVSELFSREELECNKVVYQFVYRNHYFIVINNETKNHSLTKINNKYKAASDNLKKGELIAFDPIAVEVTSVGHKLNAIILETDYGILKDCK